MKKRTCRVMVWAFQRVCFLCWVGILGLCFLDAGAQSATLQGTVVDSETGETLPGANLIVVSATMQTGTAAQEDGHFELVNLPPDTYTLTASFIGYEQQVLGDLALAAGETRVLTLSLVPTDLLINPVTVTASRRPEKLLDAPSSITVLEPEELEARTALTAAEHLKAVPAVDLISTGVNQSRIVIRGFNDNLARSLLTLVDNRVARIPSIRLTALQLIPIGASDIERIEIVSGPASALYGPNSANGVVHILTKSPFDSEGTTLSLSAGEQDLFSGALRHAGSLRNKIGYKVFAQYYAGNDFQFFDPVEVEARQAALEAGARADTLQIGARDFDIRNVALEGRLDYRFAPEGTFIVNTGFTRGNNIETSPTGAVQTIGAIVTYLQGRLRYKDLFVQAFMNSLDSGDSFALRTGEGFKENSSQFVFQAQNASSLGVREHLTYGFDVSLTRPDSRGTTNGRNEDHDDINEFGAYVQSETALASRWEAVAALRLDYHNRLADLNLSPRLALVFQPRPTHTLRLTYNRAFQTPSANEFFTDVLGQRDVFRGALLEPLVGFSPTMDLRAEGTPESGFHFRRGANGLPQFRSPYAPLDPRGLTRSSFIDLHDPIFVNVMWGVAREATVRGLAQNLADTGFLTPSQVEAVSQALAAVLPQEVEGVFNQMKSLDLEAQNFVPVDDVMDHEPLIVNRTQTLEAGYKGLLRPRLLVGLDVYHTRVKDFIGPFLVASPNIFLEETSLDTFLRSHLAAVLSDPANADLHAALLALDALPFVGNRDGLAADEVAALISGGVAGAIPFGVVTPDGAFDPTAVLLLRRNFGNISLTGVDTRFTYRATTRWSLTGTYSFVSENLFEELDDIDDIALNAPRHKWGALVRYHHPEAIFDGEVRVRHVGGFPVRSDVYVGAVEGYAVVDLSLNYHVPFAGDTRLTLSVQNLANNKHREFVDVPEIGRLAMLRLTHTF